MSDVRVAKARIVVPKFYSDDIDIGTYISIGSDVNREFVEQPSRYAIVAAQYAEAKYAARTAKKDLELVSARIGNGARKGGANDTEKKKLTRD